MAESNPDPPLPERPNPRHPATSRHRADEELIGQSSYSDVWVGPDFDTEFSVSYDGIEVLSDGTVEVQTGAGNQAALALVINRIYPIEIQKIISAGTLVAQSDIWLYKA